MKAVLVLLLIYAFQSAYGQGCSDAGFCSLSSINAESLNDTLDPKQNTLKAGVSAGYTDYDIIIFSPYLEYGRNFNNKLSANIKVNANYRTGPVTNTLAPSDAIATVSYKVTDSHSIMAGIKLPFNRSDLQHNGKHLPMAYQSSLGTVDAIIGYRTEISDFSFSLAYQQAVVQNKNMFAPEENNSEDLQKLARTTDYHRSGDVLFRVSYTHRLKEKAEKLSFIYSILPIYHLQNDSYTGTDGATYIHEGSKGLTLNLNLFANYQFNNTSQLELSTGFPILARDSRPDGLSSLAATIEYSIAF